MTKTQFLIECAKREIDPAIALENEALEAALLARNDAEAVRILNEEF